MVGSPSEYDVIFNLAEGSYQPPTFVIIWMAVLGIICLIDFAYRRGMRQVLVGIVLFGVLAFGIFSIVEHHQDYVRMRAALLGGRASVVEGVVRDFQPDSRIGNGRQRFSIEGRHFEISSNLTTPAFAHTVGTGGPDLAGKCVRAVFVSEDDSTANIVWLGIRRGGCVET